MLLPAYCPEDPNGPVSQSKALELLELMRQRFAETAYNNQNNQDDTSRQAWLHASGSQDALVWCIDLLERVVLEPHLSHDALISTAAMMERQAAELRRRAGQNK